MPRWAGWGAGPAGAGASGGPTRIFLVVVLAGAIAAAAFLFRDGHRMQAVIVGLAAVYFALRLVGGLGRGGRGGDRDEP